MGTIEPLKAELEQEKKHNEELEAKVAHCTKEVKSERNTQAIMAKQFHTKMKVTLLIHSQYTQVIMAKQFHTKMKVTPLIHSQYTQAIMAKQFHTKMKVTLLYT